MTTSLFVVHSNPVEGLEAEFNDWYDNRHLDDILAIPGFTRARRYKLSAAQFTPFEQFKYLAMYEIEGDPADVMAALQKAIDDGLYFAEAFSMEFYATVYDELGSWKVSGK